MTGGLVAKNYGEVKGTYATGNVTTNNGGDFSGGLVGGNSGVLNDSYATGNVSGDIDVGGVVGNGSATANC